MPESEITLQSVIRVLTHRWHWVVGFAAAVFVAAFLFALLLMENEYEASVKLLVSKSKAGEKIEPVDFTMKDLDTYAHLIGSRDVLAEAIEKFELNKPPFSYRIKELESMVRVEPVRNTEILQIRVTMSDPGKARDLANFLAQRAIENNFELLIAESKQSREMFQEEVDRARKHLEEAGDALSRFMAQSKTAASGQYFLSSQEALWKLKQDRSFNIALRDESRAKIDSLLEILRDEPEIRVLKRGISEERDLLDLARKKTPQVSLEDLLRLRIDNENVNYAYDKAKAELIDASKDYFGAIAHVQAIDEEIRAMEEEIRIAEQEMAEKKRRENELDVATNDYREVSMKNAEAKTMITSERQDLVVIEHAALPEEPAGPQRLVIALSAAIFAFLLALAVSLAWDMYYATMERPRGV